MAAPYIPPKDADLALWAQNFADLIDASPALYGLLPADAVAIFTANLTFQTAFVVATNPATRTTVSIAAKNAAKVALITLARTYASQIRINPGVTNADKLDLGLNLPNGSPAPIPPPATWPLLALPTAGPGLHEVRYADSSSPASRAKPPLVVQLQLFRGVAVAAIVDPLLCDFLAAVTKNPYQSIFTDLADAGKVATYFGRWLTRSGELGPWSAGVSMNIAF
jgi:hypothetical protein